MTKWKIDESHSEIGFKVKHLMITNVSGYFTRFTGNMLTNSDDFHDATISFEAAADSIDTQNRQRDEHLKNGDFFDAANHPKISFVSKKVKKVDDEQYKLLGELTIKGETHPIELDVVHAGTTVDPYGQTKAGFALKGRLHRADYGLRWNATTEAGGIVLSDEVKLNMEVQLIKEA
ncbi:polyisoprenoid-binding protein YceI [Chitinophaga polysaccharea]|uniref:Polyisoprenoid-binding protein YceI n=1 Tax=Chitinophaga polysaccharea TaxID=1293035 RepID=A0A561Q4M7_9BACT|nr:MULTISPECIES: YceI family protein [Chitinophaga]NLR61819.1 YceI family protein [Chitinophaga polysaccharea]NLU92687.1 YceI family protein [Chitinophaga sp. Ak27]TWF45322.1 polyisoprenoid-binding protein YceI [Chitinophaga polysaccharea]